MFGFTKQNVLIFGSEWLCVYPSLYGSKPPVSTGIIHTFTWVPTSFVLPIHNQGVSLAPMRGHAPWLLFLPTTGSFFVYDYCLPCGGIDSLPVTAPFPADVLLLHFASVLQLIELVGAYIECNGMEDNTNSPRGLMPPLSRVSPGI